MKYATETAMASGTGVLDDVTAWRAALDAASEPRLADTGSSLFRIPLPPDDEILRLFDDWMRVDAAAGRLSADTQQAYLSDVKQHLEWLSGKRMLLIALDLADLEAYRAWLLEQYAVSTAARKLAGVRRFYEMAYLRGKLPQNPAIRLRNPPPPMAVDEPVKPLNQKAVQRLVNVPTRLHQGRRLAQGLRDRALMVLMAMHGLRAPEICRLDVGDLDPEVEEHGALRIAGRGGRQRMVELSEESRAVLDLWLGARSLLHLETDAMFVTLNWNRSPADARARLHRRCIRAIVDRYLRVCDAKRDGISCDSLRNHYTTLGVELGSEGRTINQAVGRAGTSTPVIYHRPGDELPRAFRGSQERMSTGESTSGSFRVSSAQGGA